MLSGGESRITFYTDQELDGETGLYNYDARLYDPVIGRFISPDSIVPNAYNPKTLDPFAYCLNNPLIYTDPSGHAAGDPFDTTKEAAIDWGNTYNDDSIRNNREYGSSFYIIIKDGQKKITYTVPNIGCEHNVDESVPPNGKPDVGTIHSHGAYQDPDDNEFSNLDREIQDGDWGMRRPGAMKDRFITTPSGKLIYRPPWGFKNEEVTISPDMPSDEDDPGWNKRGSDGPDDPAIPTCPCDIPPPPPPPPEPKRPWWEFWR